MIFSDQEEQDFRRLIIRVRKTVIDIESLPQKVFERQVFRPILQGQYDQIKVFVEKHPEFKDEFLQISPEMSHQNPMAFESAFKILRTFLDSVEDTIVSAGNKQPPKEFIINPGQAFTASKIIEEILLAATSSIKIVDNFLSDESVKIIELSNNQIPISIITKKLDNNTKISFQKSKKGRKGNMEVKESTVFHDRYLILDNSIVWICGPSLDYLGVKKPGVLIMVEEPNVISAIVGLFNNEWQNTNSVI